MPTPSLHVHQITRSRHHVAGRSVRIWLPRQYAEDVTVRFPVLYLQDGQNVFGDDSAFGGVGWGVDATAQDLIDDRRVPPLILVGIDNSGAHRTDDYTPVRWQGRGGHGADFGGMLTDEIKPFVDAHYRTLPQREHTGIGGASLGGMFSLWLALERPDVFGLVAAMSPTVFWANGFLLHRVSSLQRQLPVRIWLDAGRREAPPLRKGVRQLFEALQAKGWKVHRTARLADLRHHEAARGRHDEASWGRRFDRALKFLFPPPPKPRRRRARKARSPAATG